MLKKLKNLLQTEIDPAFARRAEFILQAVEEKKPRKILEVGCGRGFYIQALSLYKFPREIHGIDLSAAYIKKAKMVCSDKRVVLKTGSIYNLPYLSESFDFVILSEVLEHLSSEKKGLAELKRILKPGGVIVITVPNNNFPFLWDPLSWALMRFFNTHVNKDIWWLAGIWAGHERLYGKKGLIALVKNQGFTIKKTIHAVHYCWPFSHFLLYGIGKNIVEVIGIKSFNRFQFEDRKIASFLAKIFRFPNNFDGKESNRSYVNLCLKAEKG